MRVAIALPVTLLFLASCGGGGGSSGSVPIAQTPPVITAAPQSASVADGTVATFSVTAAGTAPLSYQWRRGGVSIAGATSDRLTTGPVVYANDNGQEFSVVVTNAAGSVVSAPARLTVTPVAPVISSAPVATTVSDGAQATFSVAAQGTPPLTYQWSRNGALIPGATSATLVFAAGVLDSGVDFTVTVTNSVGSATSGAARLTVNPSAPVVTQQPQSVTVDAGGVATFSVAVSGTAPFSYQWQRSVDNGANWSNVLGSQSNIYGIGPLSLGHSNDLYRVQISNSAATVTSASARLTVVTTNRLVAGTLGGAGAFDATGSAARFAGVVGNPVVLPDGSILAADTSNHAVRRVSATGVVTTYAGALGEAGAVDGPVAIARLQNPSAVALDATGNVYVTTFSSVRRITNGVVSTVAGAAFIVGAADGTGSTARFGSQLGGIAIDGAGNILVADTFNHTIRRITPTGVTTTVAGSAGTAGSADGNAATARFNLPGSLAFDASGNLLIVDTGNATVRQLTPQGVVSTWLGVAGDRRLIDGQRTSARLLDPHGLAVDAAGNVFIADQNTIRRVNTSGQVITVSGDIERDYVDGPAGSSRFASPTGLVARSDGSVVVADSNNYALRVVTATGAVSTLAGLGFKQGAADGVGAAARFQGACAIVAAPSGDWIVSDRLDATIRRIAANGAVSTIAGLSGALGSVDGIGSAARLRAPCAGSFDAAGNFVFIDGHAVRRMTPSGAITTLAGDVIDPGSIDGTGAAARFNQPFGLIVDRASGDAFVADTFNYTIRRVTAGGVVTTFAGSSGQLGAADGTGSAARFSNPVALAMDASRNLYVAEGTHLIRKITPGGSVTTFAGAYTGPGYADDAGVLARFNGPTALAIDGAGNLFVADTGNSVIRKITPTGYVSTVAGRRGQRVLQLGRDGNLNAPVAIATDAGGRVYFVSEQAVVRD